MEELFAVLCSVTLGSYIGLIFSLDDTRESFVETMKLTINILLTIIILIGIKLEFEKASLRKRDKALGTLKSNSKLSNQVEHRRIQKVQRAKGGQE